ncbi:hypothetical protein WKH56_06690 [Priestia sp. SB1]|uniref:hypothetical protein n=1 Tax=Priestia sp. SB1 TaxID=3132359 RepID=UPI00317E4D83
MSAVLQKIEQVSQEIENEEMKLEIMDAVRSIFSKYEVPVEKEKERQEMMLSEQYAHRLNVPVEQWDKIPEGMTIGQWFKKEVLPKSQGSTNEK